MGSSLDPLSACSPPARRRGRLGGARLVPPARWSRGRRGRLMARAARVPGSGPGRANVRSPRPRAAGAPASTPGADRYASGGGRQGAPPPSGASDCRSGASRAAVGAGWMRGGTPRGGLPAPYSLQCAPLSALCPPASTICLSLSLPIHVVGGLVSRPPREAGDEVSPLRSFPSLLASGGLGVPSGSYADKD